MVPDDEQIGQTSVPQVRKKIINILNLEGGANINAAMMHH